jgi:hypothetical protein
MKRLPLVALAIALSALPAQAQVMLSDDFNSESGGNSSLNYNGFVNWDVVGQVDLVGMPNGFGITCSGSCVDLDGSTGPGRLRSKSAFAVTAGERWTLAFAISGSQRSVANDNISAGFFLENSATGTNLTGTGGFAFAPFAGPFSGDVASVSNIGGLTPFSVWSVSFDALTSGTVRFQIGTASADNVGPLIDNVVISKTAVVPEPATMALLAVGLGALGVVARRRSNNA